MSKRAIAAAAARGELSRVRLGWYARSGCCGPLWAAAAHGGVLACLSAARHLGIWVLDQSAHVHVWMPRDGHRTGTHSDPEEPCGCIEHWHDHPWGKHTITPTVPQLLRQILGCRGLTDFFVALESARRQRLITRDGLDWLRANTNSSARAAIDYSRDDADSGLESLFRWRLRDLGVPIRCQVQIVGVGRVDFLVGDRLLVEIDGRENHTGAEHRHKDLVRDANAAAWGYTTLRFDYALVVHDWESVSAAVRTAVESGRHLA